MTSPAKPAGRRLAAGFGTVAALLVLNGGAAAQEVPAQLTVEAARQLARQYNPAIRRAANDAEVASWNVRQAWAAFLPTLSTGLGFGANRSTRLSGEDDYGQPVASPIRRTFSSSSASQSIGASLTLFDGGANLRRLGAQRAQARATDYLIEAQTVSELAQVERAWYQALRAQQNIALEEQLLASARDRVERAEALLRLAANDQVDVLGARADVATQQQNLERARGEVQKSRLLLLAAMGVESARAFELAGDLPAVFDPGLLGVDSLVSVALSVNAGLQQRQALAAASRQQASAARGTRLPRISVSGSYGRSVSADRYEAFGQFDLPNSSTGLSLNVSLPLFSGFSTSAQIASADAAARDAEEELRGQRLQLETRVRNAHTDLVNAYRSLELAEQSAALSKERLELAQEKFRLGAISFTELQQVIDRTSQAERGALDARFTFVGARIALEEQLGTRIEP